MLKNQAKTFLAKTDMITREEWLEARRKGIGGSEASAILGLNPYSSPLRVYLDKIGKGEEKETNEAMRQGTDLEQYVADRFVQFMAESGTPVKVRRVNKMFQHPEHPWMLANIDRDIAGMDAGLECKTTSAYSKFKFEEGEINPHYYWQAMHYMACTGAQAWYVAVLVLGKSFNVFKIERDEDAIETLTDAERIFWEEHVQAKVPPLPTGSEEDGEAIGTMFPKGKEDAEAVDLGEMDDALNLRDMKQKQLKELETEIAEIDQQIKMMMGDAQKGFSTGWKVSWANVSSSRVDSKLLKEKYPDVAAECMKTTDTRRFSVSKLKEEK